MGRGQGTAQRVGGCAGSRVALAVEPARQVPPLGLLSRGEPKPNDLWDIHEKVRTLNTFFSEQRLGVRVSHISCGPMTTSFGLRLPPGTLTSAVKRLQEDIGLRLGNAHGCQVRIDGDRVWVDLPNPNPETVALRDLLESPEYRRDQQSGRPSPLLLPVGRDTRNQAICADLSTMPHMIVAGQSGSGKSVFLNSVVTAVLATKDPREVELTLIDPKKTEFSPFAGVPHLAPIPGVCDRGEVITDTAGAREAIRQLIVEMDRRYTLMSQAGAGRGIADYNRQARARGLPPLPYRIVVVDEMAELARPLGNTKEERRAAEDFLKDLTHLSAKARAAGIHLILATQSPRVDYITGAIKANCPARVAFSVSQQIESNIILDEPGAEALTRKGDMLFRNSGVPARMRGPFVGDDEGQRVVEFWRQSPLTSLLASRSAGYKTASAPVPDGRSALGARLAG